MIATNYEPVEDVGDVILAPKRLIDNQDAPTP